MDSLQTNGVNGRPACAGSGWLQVKSVAGKSAVTSARAVSPLKLLIPRSRGDSVWAYLSSFGGGLLGGDETRVQVDLDANTRCFLSTQAATRVYRNPACRPCGHALEANIGVGAELFYVPDPVQAFAGARYRQSQRFQMDAGSGLVVVDSLSSGRAARGERWAFDRFQSCTEVFYKGERFVFDSLLLDPLDGAIDGPCRLGRFNCLALILVLGEPMAEAAGQLIEAESRRPVEQRASLISSVGRIRHGVVIRLAGERGEDVSREVQRLLQFIPAHLGDNPWARKW